MQSTHSIADFAHEHAETFASWKQDSNSIIALQARDESHLIELNSKFKTLTPTSMFFEPDVDAYTSVCLYGTPEIRKKLSHLPLSLKTK